MDYEYVDAYVVMHPRGKLVSDKTKSGLTTNFHEARVWEYDRAIGFCNEMAYEFKGYYQIHHVDAFKNNEGRSFTVHSGVNTRNLKRLFKSIDENHHVIKRIEDFEAKHGDGLAYPTYEQVMECLQENEELLILIRGMNLNN